MDASEIHVLAAGTMLPGPAIDNCALARRFGMNQVWEQWVNSFIGTSTRHLSLDVGTGERTHTLTDLAQTAASRALAAASLRPADIDLIVMGTSTPDLLMPATVNVLADRLGIDDVPTYQLQSGCAGAVQALDVAAQMLATGRHHTALVVGGDTVVKHVDTHLDLARLAPEQLVNVVLFGDGAGAAVLADRPGPGSALLRTTFVRLAGLGRAPGHTVEWFGRVTGTATHPAAARTTRRSRNWCPRWPRRSSASCSRNWTGPGRTSTICYRPSCPGR